MENYSSSAKKGIPLDKKAAAGYMERPKLVLGLKVGWKKLLIQATTLIRYQTFGSVFNKILFLFRGFVGMLISLLFIVLSGLDVLFFFLPSPIDPKPYRYVIW